MTGIAFLYCSGKHDWHSIPLLFWKHDWHSFPLLSRKPCVPRRMDGTGGADSCSICLESLEQPGQGCQQSSVATGCTSAAWRRCGGSAARGAAPSAYAGSAARGKRSSSPRLRCSTWTPGTQRRNVFTWRALRRAAAFFLSDTDFNL